MAVSMATTSMTVTMLVKTGPHDNVDQDPEAGGDKHGLGLHLMLPGDDPERGGVNQDTCQPGVNILPPKNQGNFSKK